MHAKRLNQRREPAPQRRRGRGPKSSFLRQVLKDKGNQSEQVRLVKPCDLMAGRLEPGLGLSNGEEEVVACVLNIAGQQEVGTSSCQGLANPQESPPGEGNAAGCSGPSPQQRSRDDSQQGLPGKRDVPGRLEAASQAGLPRGNGIDHLQKMRIRPASVEKVSPVLDQMSVRFGDAPRPDATDVVQSTTSSREPSLKSLEQLVAPDLCRPLHGAAFGRTRPARAACLFLSAASRGGAGCHGSSEAGQQAENKAKP